MSPAQIAVREEVKRLSLADVGRSLNAVADRFLALWAGDAAAAKQSLRRMPMEPELKRMLCLGVDTVVTRRQRQIDYELNGLRIHRSYR